ncbi:MAG: MarR family transcriptional regulator [Candidatus Thermoplasmatota archaeon]|jgi:DNA-binding MarR family transcriptional regulator|nr:MarR family transcriptional regulator [Candidatus Thermoplasmatota archaeon]MCL5786349.1 MarR family transcriptional regulator [Candidatus Thermoplasmatota archaeon]
MISEYGELLGSVAILRKLRMKIMNEISSQLGDLTATDLFVLTRICEGDPGLTMTDLSNLTGFSNAIITFSVDSMEEKSLVKRERGEDRRIYQVSATERGIEKYEEILVDQGKVVDRIFSQMSKKDRERLVTLLSELKKLLSNYF